MYNCSYLAPEYAQSGEITEKTDVYSFGVVLVELVTGRKAMDLNKPKGQQCLTEWVCMSKGNYGLKMQHLNSHIVANIQEKEIHSFSNSFGKYLYSCLW